MQRITVLVLAIALSAGVAAASDDSRLPLPQFGGYGYWMFGQIVKGEDFGGSIDHQWSSQALVGLRMNAHPMPRLHVILSPEFKLFFPSPERTNNVSTVRPISSAYINEGQGIFSLGNLEKPFLDIAVGMFNYKYNPQARNLGEYLFRTGTYPPTVFTDYDYAQTRLLGLRVGTRVVPDLSVDAMLTSEYQIYPLYDFSLSLIAGYKLLDAIDIGAGIVGARLIPVDRKKTSPEFADGVGDNFYVNNNGDTAYYSFQATKVMARLSLDPKALFRGVKIFGAEDLKLYAEVAMMGVEGYQAVPDSQHPAFYNDLLKRTPIMIGLNVPAFKILDVLAVELEYYHSGLPNDYRKQVTTFTPMPNISDPQSYDPRVYTDPGVRWSVYMTKQVVKGLSLTGQGAYDHLRRPAFDGSQTTGECLNKPGDWSWFVKIGYAL